MALLTTSFALFLAASAGSPAVTPAEPKPASMSPSEIRAFNATVATDHPYYIRCKRSGSTGSLVKASTTCRTNAQWAIANDRGNDKAREYAESYGKAWSNGN